MLISMKEIDYKIFTKIVDLYRNDTYTHSYLLYDLIYEYNNVDLYLYIRNNTIDAYRLLWRDSDYSSLIIWSRNCNNIYDFIDIGFINSLEKNTIITLFAENKCLDDFFKQLSKSRWSFETENFYLMVANAYSFKPYFPERARRLNENDVYEFIDIKKTQKSELEYGLGELSIERAIDLINKYRYYGVFVNNKLVSIGCRYMSLPEVSIVGDIYTRSEYRNKGFGKIITSAITRDIVNYGAEALLYVSKNNTIAISVYEKLGYRVIGESIWVFIE